MQNKVAKEKQLEKLLSSYDSALIAFSGGVDSSYLLFKALQVLGRQKVLAVTVHSQLHSTGAADAAEKLARKMGAKHLILSLDLLAEPAVRENSVERCYFCKKSIYLKMLTIAKERGYSTMLDGSNTDDQGDHRPGFRAMQELGISSPLLASNITKEEVRFFSEQAGLSTFNKPSESCLASRFPYGRAINSDVLRQVEKAEQFLREMGFTGDLRVRNHGDLARIEIKETDFDLLLQGRESVLSKLQELGFIYITLDLDGFTSGSMNRPLKSRE